MSGFDKKPEHFEHKEHYVDFYNPYPTELVFTNTDKNLPGKTIVS